MKRAGRGDIFVFRPYARWYLLAWGTFGALSVGVALRTAVSDADDRVFRVLQLVPFALIVVFVLRLAHCGIGVSADRITIRNPLRTVTLAHEDVERFAVDLTRFLRFRRAVLTVHDRHGRRWHVWVISYGLVFPVARSRTRRASRLLNEWLSPRDIEARSG